MEPVVFGTIIDGHIYRERQAVYGLLFNDKNQLGIVNTPRGNFLPGGGLKNEENHYDCLKREFLEETGFVIDVGDYLGSAILYDFAPTIQEYLKMVGHFYKVHFTGLMQEKIEDEHELVWFDRTVAERSMLLEHQSWAIKRINATMYSSVEYVIENKDNPIITKCIIGR